MTVYQQKPTANFEQESAVWARLGQAGQYESKQSGAVQGQPQHEGLVQATY
jgi:hypothetical protein